MKRISLQKLMEASEWLLNEWCGDEDRELTKDLIDLAQETALLIWNGGKNAELPWYEVDGCMEIFHREER